MKEKLYNFISLGIMHLIIHPIYVIWEFIDSIKTKIELKWIERKDN
jgi:hypothetical protein